MTSQQAEPITIAPGAVLAGKYRVERLIRESASGTVLEARHLTVPERVAVRLLAPHLARDVDGARRFMDEGHAAGCLRGPHVARVVDVGALDEGSPYVATEYLEGDDLSSLIRRRGPMALAESIDHILQACEAVAEAHAHRIVHRAINPSNLFVVRAPDGRETLKVLDFGVARSLHADAHGPTGDDGDLAWARSLAPEQLQPMQTIDHRADIYGLGVSLFELLTGTTPFTASSLPELRAEILTGVPQPLSSLRPDLSDAFAKTLERSYARDRERRYRSVADFAQALAVHGAPEAALAAQRIARLTTTISVSPPAPPPIAIAHAPMETARIVLEPYSGPKSSKAAAAFATTNKTALSPMHALLAQPRVGLGIAAVSFACISAIGGALVWRYHARDAGASLPPPTRLETTAAPLASVTPADPVGSVEATARPEVTAAASASASAKARAHAQEDH